MDYYKILQVDPEAEEEVIKAAYKRLSEKYHPDRNKAPDAEDRQKRLNVARDVLLDPDRRREYDRKRRADHERPSAPATSRPQQPQANARPPEPPATSRPQPPDTRERKTTAVDNLVGFGRRAVGLAVALVVAVSVRSCVRDQQRQKREQEERSATAKAVAAMDPSKEFSRELEAFTIECEKTGAVHAPEFARGYCACVAELMKGRFDDRPLTATTLAGARNEMAVRLRWVIPSDAETRRCADAQVPPPVTAPAKRAKPVKPKTQRRADPFEQFSLDLEAARNARRP